MDNVPQYAQDPIFREIVSLCKMAGVHVVFVNEMHDISGYAGKTMAETSEDSEIINMSADSDYYQNETQAALILGHELAHHLVKKWYLPTETQTQFNGSNYIYINLSLHSALEADCDRIGAAIYELSCMIASHKAEQAFDELCKQSDNESEK